VRHRVQLILAVDGAISHPIGSCWRERELIGRQECGGVESKEDALPGETRRRLNSGLGPWRGGHEGLQPADQRRMVGPRAEAGLGCRPGIAASSEQRRLHTTRLRDARGGLETLQQMA
jgi:hypothetical protein